MNITLQLCSGNVTFNYIWTFILTLVWIPHMPEKTTPYRSFTHFLEFAHINWTLNCFLTTYHPSFLVRWWMLVHCGLESPPLRARVVALHSRMVLAARLRYTWLEWEPDEKVADRKHRVVSALLVYLFLIFFSRSFGESLEICFFFSPSSPSLCRGFLPFFRSVCVLCGFVDGSRNLFWSHY